MTTSRTIEIGSRLRDSRLKANLSPQQVALELKVSAKSIYAWEAGSREVGSVRLADLCLIYGVDPGFVLFGTHTEPAELRALFARLGRRPSSEG